MVELAIAEGCIMKKKMLKIKPHHPHGLRHGHGHIHVHGLKKHHGGADICGGPSLAGHPSGLVGGEVFIVFRGRHHHYRHHHRHHHHHGHNYSGLIPQGEDHSHHHGKMRHRKGHELRHGHKLFGHHHHHHRGIEAGLKHHGRRLHRRCVKLGFVQHEGGEGSGAEAGGQQGTEAALTVPQAEAMMENLTLATTDKEPNMQA